MSSDTAAEQFSERLLGATLGMIDVLAVFLGDRLGWYRTLAADGSATAAELVARAGGRSGTHRNGSSSRPARES